jgi:hypothetical protein
VGQVHEQRGRVRHVVPDLICMNLLRPISSVWIDAAKRHSQLLRKVFWGAALRCQPSVPPGRPDQEAVEGHLHLRRAPAKMSAVLDVCLR